MKNILTALLVISCASAATILSAQTTDQTPAPPPTQTTAKVHAIQTPEAQVRHLANILALTSDQQNQILPILKDRDSQVNSIEADTTLSKKERHSRLLAVRADAQSRLRNVLTDTQRTAYDEMQQEQRERARTKRMGTVSN